MPQITWKNINQDQTGYRSLHDAYTGQTNAANSLINTGSNYLGELSKRQDRIDAANTRDNTAMIIDRMNQAKTQEDIDNLRNSGILNPSFLRDATNNQIDKSRIIDANNNFEKDAYGRFQAQDSLKLSDPKVQALMAHFRSAMVNNDEKTMQSIMSDPNVPENVKNELAKQTATSHAYNVDRSDKVIGLENQNRASVIRSQQEYDDANIAYKNAKAAYVNNLKDDGSFDTTHPEYAQAIANARVKLMSDKDTYMGNNKHYGFQPRNDFNIDNYGVTQTAIPNNINSTGSTNLSADASTNIDNTQLRADTNNIANTGLSNPSAQALARSNNIDINSVNREPETQIGNNQTAKPVNNTSINTNPDITDSRDLTNQIAKQENKSPIDLAKNKAQQAQEQIDSKKTKPPIDYNKDYDGKTITSTFAPAKSDQEVVDENRKASLKAIDRLTKDVKDTGQTQAKNQAQYGVLEKYIDAVSKDDTKTANDLLKSNGQLLHSFASKYGNVTKDTIASAQKAAKEYIDLQANGLAENIIASDDTTPIVAQKPDLLTTMEHYNKTSYTQFNGSQVDSLANSKIINDLGKLNKNSSDGSYSALAEELFGSNVEDSVQLGKLVKDIYDQNPNNFSPAYLNALYVNAVKQSRDYVDSGKGTSSTLSNNFWSSHFGNAKDERRNFIDELKSLSTMDSEQWNNLEKKYKNYQKGVRTINNPVNRMLTTVKFLDSQGDLTPRGLLETEYNNPESLSYNLNKTKAYTDRMYSAKLKDSISKPIPSSDGKNKTTVEEEITKAYNQTTERVKAYNNPLAGSPYNRQPMAKGDVSAIKELHLNEDVHKLLTDSNASNNEKVKELKRKITYIINNNPAVKIKFK